MRATAPTLGLTMTMTALVVLPQTPIYAQAANEPELQEWTVPYEGSRPRDPMLGPDGKVWFVGQVSDYVAALDPETGSFERFDLTEGTGPHNVIVDRDGTLWYAGNRDRHIGHLNPETGEISKIEMPDGAARDPHTLTFDSHGDIWFTVQGGNFIGKLTTSTGEVRLVEGPRVRSDRGSSSRPYGIVVDAEDRPWIALFNTNAIATVDPETFELETFELPENALPRRLDVTSDGMVWYGDYRRGYLGRLDPATGEVSEWTLPSGEDARPYALAADDADRIWVVETGVQPNRFVGFDPRTESFTSVPVESGGGTVRHMYFDAESNAIWFGADTNTIGVAKLPPGRPVSD
ncbi:MAG: lyase [Gemmatimonadota bacterium]